MTDDFKAGYEAAMRECEDRIRRAERAERNAMALAAAAHHHAKRVAEMLRPCAEIEMLRMDREPFSVAVTADVLALLRPVKP